MFSNDKIFNKIVEALLVDYSSVYYVNAITNEYQWYSVDPKFHSLHIEQGGEDFFKNMIRDAEMVVHEDDRHIFTYELQKDKLISAMKKGTMKSYEYRLLINGKPVYHSLRLIRGLSDNEDYFILGIINIEKEVDLRNNAEKFKREIDAACVYVNASTRFTDGGEFGLGAEIGISTQKIHARGPMGLAALTSWKYLIDGNGQIR